MLLILQDNGYDFNVNGEIVNFRGTIAYVSGDNLGSNDIGGFKESSSAHRKCRQCMGTSEDCRCKVIKGILNYKENIEYLFSLAIFNLIIQSPI